MSAEKLEQITKELGELGSAIQAGFTKVDSNFGAVKTQIDALQKKVDNLTKEVEKLKGDTSDGLETVGVKLESLTEEIQKIALVTDYDKQIENLRGFN